MLIAQSVEMLAASHETEALRQSVLLYAKVGCKIESSEEASVFKIVEVLKHFFRQRALSLVREAGHQPLLYVYAADATSLLCRSESQSMLEGSLVRRRGRALLELLMQRGVLKTVSAAGVHSSATLFAEPCPLTDGKTAWNLFAAASKFFPVLKSAGHRGISLTQIVADRAVMVPLQRTLHQREEAFFMPAHNSNAGEAAGLERLLSWHIATGCAAHDAQNALKWALAPYATVDLLRDLHIIVEALRNSFSASRATLGLSLNTCCL